MPVARVVPVAATLLLAGLTGCSPGSPRSPAPPAATRPTASTARAPLALPTAPTAWSQASGDAARSSATATIGPQQATVRWQRRLEGAVTPGAAVGTDGSVLLASDGGVLHALDPATGSDRWTVGGGGRYGSDLSTTPAVLGDGTILWPAPGNRLLALNQHGKMLWSQTFSGFVLSPAVVGGDRVYVGDQAGRLSALDVRPGGAHSTAWTLELGGTSYGSPAVGADGTVYTTTGRQLVAVTDRGTSGTVRWRFSARDTVEVSPAVAADGTVVLGTNGDDEIGVGPDGRERWRFPKGDFSYSSPVVRAGKAYFGDHLGYLDVLDAATGRQLRRDLGIPKAQGTTGDGTGVWTAPLVDAAGDVYSGTAAGRVYGTGPDGRRLFDLDAGSVVASYPALTADGTLVIGSQGGTVYALRG